jgi:AraC family transcriptional regulator of adaptative response/methylated-DNA-[protein]-cysteine methyltransferase
VFTCSQTPKYRYRRDDRDAGILQRSLIMVSIRLTDETVPAGERELIRFAFGECSLGRILVAATSEGVSAILLGDDRDSLQRDLRGRFPTTQLIDGGKAFEPLVGEIVALVEMPARGIALPLDLRGTRFQRRVWRALREIPVGATASYREIADRIGAAKAVRAVARACAANALAVAIPCHRVVRADGAPSGYRWGVARKRILLDREAA